MMRMFLAHFLQMPVILASPAPGQSGPVSSMFLCDVTEHEGDNANCDLKTTKLDDVNGMSSWLLKHHKSSVLLG